MFFHFNHSFVKRNSVPQLFFRAIIHPLPISYAFALRYYDSCQTAFGRRDASVAAVVSAVRAELCAVSTCVEPDVVIDWQRCINSIHYTANDVSWWSCDPVHSTTRCTCRWTILWVPTWLSVCRIHILHTISVCQDLWCELSVCGKYSNFFLKLHDISILERAWVLRWHRWILSHSFPHIKWKWSPIIECGDQDGQPTIISNQFRHRLH